MVNEYDFTEENKIFFETQGNLLKKNFERRHVETSLLYDEESVYAYIKRFIEDRPYIKNIAFSDGVTLYQLNLFNWAKENLGGAEIKQPLRRGPGGHYAAYGDQPEGRMHLPYEEWKTYHDKWYEDCRRSLLSDLLIISANAVTLNGEIVSIDGLGNRVTGMMFGPLHVICIVGRNKIVPNVDYALERIHNFVAPLTYIRHNNKHNASFQDVPCVKTGKCFNCSHEYSSCRDVVIMRGQVKQHKDRLHLLVINKELGF